MARVQMYRRMGALLAVATLMVLGYARGADPAANEEVIARYEQILEREPMEGPSLDKLLQIYQEGEGLEKLDARWAPQSAQPGAKGGTYSLLRGLLADRMAKTDQARKLLQAATQAAPDDFHEWLALGDFEARQGKWTDAITALQKGLATQVAGDDRLSLYRKLGQAQERNLDTAAALATWQKMVEEFPKDSFALEEAGTAELDAEQFDEAKKTFQKLVDLTEPNSMNRVQALMRLAEVDDRQGKTDDAVHDYETILPLTAEASWLNRELRAQIEQVYRRQDDLAGLVSYYQKWTTDNPKDVEALLLLAGTLNELGKKPEALDVLRKVTVLAPDRHEVRESFAQALVEAKQYDEAITVLTALTADDPTEPRYWETMGDAMLAKTQPPTPESKKTALDAWAHIAPADSKDVAAVLEVADLCRDHGLNDEALAGYNRALGLTPDASDIREKAVKLLVDLKREDEAWKLLEGMVDGPLATAGNYLKLATLDLQFGRKDAAAEAIQKGLALEPGNFDLLSQQWSLLAEAQNWTDCIALFDKLVAAAPNTYFIDQLEARQVQALTSAGQLDATEKGLRAKLGADPGLSEGELRMLMRIMVQQSDADVPKVIDEAHRRFPQSVSLIRMEIDYNRHTGNYDAAVAGLQKLIETQPAQKGDWLAEMVHVRQDQGNLDEAMKAAQQIIDASPTTADGYLLYAEIAFNANKADDATAKLQAAIKISDKANDIRLRLARHYLESDQAGKARTVYDDAFAAADSPQDKLNIVRAMAAAYFQDGQIEELINRFKKEQNSEEGGWRYGLYLSAIDEQMEDYGAARRELAKSLAVRPNDTNLLHSLIGLAEKEGDLAELLRYRELLAAADPSAANQLALANEYATQNKPEEAWRIVQKEQAEVVKDPMAWKDVLNQISDPDYAAKIKTVLQEAIRAKGDSFGGKFALVQFQIQQGDITGAKATLWEILAQPLPTTPPVAPANPTAPVGPVFGYGFYQGPLFQRSSQSYMAINEVQQLLATAQNGNNNAQRQRMAFSRYRNMNIYGQGVTATLDPQAIKDHALIYLSVIALQEKQAEDLLKEFQAKFDEWHWSLSERVVAFSLIQAREPLLAAIEEQAKSGTPDKDLDGFCFMACESFMAQPNVLTPDDAMNKRATAAQALLGARLGQDPQFKSVMAMMEINRLASDTSPDALTKKKAAMVEYLKTLDRKDPEALVAAITHTAQLGNWDDIKKMVNDLAATDRTKWSSGLTQQLAFLPMTILNTTTTAKETANKDVVAVIWQLVRLGYPATPPQAALATTASPFFGRSYNQNMFPPPNRYFGFDRIGSLEPLFQQIKARNLLPEMYAALDEEEKSATDWRRVYPELYRIYFQWWEGKHDDSIASVKKLIEQDSSDDFKQLLAAMLTQQQKYDDAIPVLNSISARYGPDYIRTQIQLLHVARLAKNDDEGQKAGLRLIALRLPQQEQMQILDDLRNVGLKDKADAIMKQQSGRGPNGAYTQARQAGNQLRQSLSEAVAGGNETLATDLAHQILNRDPLAPGYGNESYIRDEALNALHRMGKLDDYTQDVVKQLQAAPDSVKLNWLAAEAYQNMDGRVEKAVGFGAFPQWLKLTRTGNDLQSFYSFNGTDWTALGEAKVDLPAKSYLGFWVSEDREGVPAQASVDQIAFTGKTSVAETVPLTAPPSVPASTNAPSGTVPNAPTTNTASNPSAPAPKNAPTALPPTLPGPPLPAPWTQVDIGGVMKPGATKCEANGTLDLTGALGGGTHYVYQTLDGDGTVVARFNNLTGQSNSRSAMTGIMIRETLASGSRAAEVAFDPVQGVRWRFRSTAVTEDNAQAPGAAPFTLTFNMKPYSNGWAAKAPGESTGWSTHEVGEFNTPFWLKILRKGDTFKGSASQDGITWSEIFSQNVVMGPDMRAGLMGAINGSTSSQSVWSGIKINGVAQNAPPASPSTPPGGTAPSAAAPPTTPLGPPWDLIDIGNSTQPGTAVWSGPKLQLSSTAQLHESGVRNYTFVYQTVHGDCEIEAHLESQREMDFQSCDGIAIRSRLDPSSPEINLLRFNANQLNYYVATNAPELALKYYRHLAELEPKNQTVLMQIASQFQKAKRPGDAVDIYLAMMKTDFPTAISQYGGMLQSFEEANRLPDLLKVIDDWTQPPLNPMGGGQDMYFVLLQMANQLRQGQHLPEAERVYRKALGLDTFQNKQDGVVALARVLMDENRHDDAAAEVEKWLMDQGVPKASTPPPLLGLNYQGMQQQQQNNWFQSLGWDQNGMINAPIIHLFELAVDLGLAPKLEGELRERAAKKGPSPVGVVDPDRMTSIMLAILAHDVAYRGEVEKLLKDFPATAPNFSSNMNVFLILVQELEKWTEERATALRIAKTVYDGMATNPNVFFRNIAGLQLLRIATAMGDHKTVQATLRSLADAARAQHAGNAGQVSVEQQILIIHDMVQEGMLKEAADMLADARTDPQLANGINTYYQQKIDQVQKEIDFAKGGAEPASLVYGLYPAPKGTTFFWELSPSAGVHHESFEPEVDWDNTLTIAPTTYRIEVNGGPDESHVTTKIATYDNVPTRGSGPIKIPPGMQVLQAVLVRTKPLPVVPPATPDAVPEVVDTGHLIPLAGAENLLKNPDFKESKDAAGQSTIAGWRGVLPSSVSQETLGPLPSGCVAIEVNNGVAGNVEIVADRIAIQPGTNYVFTGWVQGGSQLGWRCLDVDGKVLATHQFLGSRTESGWFWRAFTLGQRTPGRRTGGEAIPARTAFVEIFLHPNQNFSFAGLAFRVWPTNAPAAPPPAAGSSAVAPAPPKPAAHE